MSRQAKSSENILVRMNGEMEAELMETKKQKEIIMLERNSLLESLKRTNEEFILLKKKRIQDVSFVYTRHYKYIINCLQFTFFKLLYYYLCLLKIHIVGIFYIPNLENAYCIELLYFI